MCNVWFRALVMHFLRGKRFECRLSLMQSKIYENFIFKSFSYEQSRAHAIEQRRSCLCIREAGNNSVLLQQAKEKKLSMYKPEIHISFLFLRSCFIRISMKQCGRNFLGKALAIEIFASYYFFPQTLIAQTNFRGFPWIIETGSYTKSIQ